MEGGHLLCLETVSLGSKRGKTLGQILSTLGILFAAHKESRWHQSFHVKFTTELYDISFR